MRALSIRQPFAELILRGIKTVEYRSRATRIIGEPFYIYASKGRVQASRVRGQRSEVGAMSDLRSLSSPALVSDNLAADAPPGWMIELAEQLRLIEPGALLPTGVIVGTAVIERCVPVAAHGLAPTHYAWHLREVERVQRHRKPKRMPQPVWFVPF
jgi:hypothetical protein